MLPLVLSCDDIYTFAFIEELYYCIVKNFGGKKVWRKLRLKRLAEYSDQYSFAL